MAMNLLNMKSLLARRNLADLCTLHAILNGRIDSSNLLSQLKFRVPTSNSRSTRTCTIFRTAIVSTNNAVNHPLRRMMESANNLAGEEKFQIFDTKLGAFKKLMNNIM